MPEGLEASSGVGVRTTCPYCGVGCGVIVGRGGSGDWRVAGDRDHPANFGRLCSKGSALGETLDDEGRLLYPHIDGQRVTWDKAIDAVADGFSAVRRRHVPNAIAFYLSGQLLTEDYYVANKLMKGFVGSPHVDTNSRLCMASSVAGHRRAFGADLVPGCYEDLDQARLIVLTGSNAAWCHPVLFQRMIANRAANGARIVVIDPRRTATAAEADLHLPIRPGTDISLFSGLLVYLAANDALEPVFIGTSTTGFDTALAAARMDAPSVDAVAETTGLSRELVLDFFQSFLSTEKTVTCYSQGVHQSVAGTDKVNAIINCHLATGRIGRPGMGPFSLTGQPNAMGGREVGGLANQLAAHMGFSAEDIDRVGRFWNAPNMVTGEGLKAVQMFEAIADGRIKALWVMATNPVVSLPRADAMRDALANLEMFVVSDCVAGTDTVSRASIRLPAAAWGEKDGTVTNSERRISRQRAFRDPPGEARPDWWIVSAVARRLGYGEAFQYGSAADIFREHAGLTAFENDGARDLDLTGLSDVSDTAYDQLSPIQWPVRGDSRTGQARMITDGRFFTPDGRAAFISVTANAVPDRPLLLNTGRIRDQWHTMTRTGTTPRLCLHIPEPFVEIHPDDAAAAGLDDGGLAVVRSDHGEATLRVSVTPEQQRGSLFAPIHWSSANSAAGRIGAVVHGDVDPLSGQPDSKATPVSVTPLACSHYGFLLSRAPLMIPDAAYWARARSAHGYTTFMAFTEQVTEGWEPWLKRVLGASEEDFIHLTDDQTHVHRAASVDSGRLIACGFINAEATLPALDWLESLFDVETMDRVLRRGILTGRPLDGFIDPGNLICACFGVGENAIAETIRTQSLSSTEEIGLELKAGTNCGSCLPELRRLLSA